MDRVGREDVRVRWLIGVGCGAALALTPASAQRDPLAPLPESAAPAPVRVAPQPTRMMLQQPTVNRPGPVYAPGAAGAASDSGFARYKPFLAAQARAAGVREATVAAVMPSLALNSRATSPIPT